MRLTKILATGLLSLALAPLANADVTINITGSTAFRAVTHQAILNIMAPGRASTREGTSDTPSKTAMKDVQRACFKGVVAGITGTTTVNCNWNGSVEGMTIVGAGFPTAGWINPATATFAH